MELQDQIKNRQWYNRLILEELAKIVDSCPYLRFGQIISNYATPKGTNDYFFPESFEIYQELKQNIDNLKL